MHGAVSNLVTPIDADNPAATDLGADLLRRRRKARERGFSRWFDEYEFPFARGLHRQIRRKDALTLT